MIRRFLHIAFLLIALLATGCVRENAFSVDTPGIKLTVRCDESELTKADETRDGEQSYNENIIQSVDFLFYSGENPSSSADAVYHVRKELSRDSMLPGSWEETFNLVIKREIIETRIFAHSNRAKVYVLVNFDASFIGDLSLTSSEDLSARKLITDFAASEEGYIQPCFQMDGDAVVEYDEDDAPNVDATILVKRFASKLTVGFHVEPRVELVHRNHEQDPNEIWEPVLHTMRVYLVDGIKSVVLSSHDGMLPDPQTADPDPEYFSYSSSATKRPFVRDNGTAYFDFETVGDKQYYTTWPMYSYPSTWTSDITSYSSYTAGASVFQAGDGLEETSGKRL